MLWWAGDNHCDSALSLLPPIFAVILLYAIEKKKHLKTVRAPEVFAKGTDLLVSQILTLWEASTIRIACGSSGTSGEAVQTFMTLTEVQHRICRVWIKSDSYTTDLVSAKRHSVFETSFTAQLGSEETRKEIVTWAFLHCIVYRIHRKIFGLIFW